MISVLLPGSIVAVFCCIIIQNSTFPRILPQPSPVQCRVATPPCRPDTVTPRPPPASSLTTVTSTKAWLLTRSRPPRASLAPLRALRGEPGTVTWPTLAPCPAPCPRSSPGVPRRRSISCQEPLAITGARALRVTSRGAALCPQYNNGME